MRRAKLILGVSAVMMAMMIAFAAPAMAEDRDFDDRDSFFFFVDCDFYDCNDNDDDFCYFYDCRFDGFGFNDGSGFQDFEQEAESGDIDQSFDVTGGGDNSNQTANVSGVSNTGNLQDQSGFTLIGSDIDEFEIDDVGSSLEVSGGSDVSSEQNINQSASSK